jgi:hypothetical protein
VFCCFYSAGNDKAVQRRVEAVIVSFRKHSNLNNFAPHSSTRNDREMKGRMKSEESSKEMNGKNKKMKEERRGC